ncbi:hypothetical protein ACWKT5_26385 [Streptomyces avermitilis]
MPRPADRLTVRVEAVRDDVGADNAWILLHEMARGGSVAAEYGLEVLDTVICLPRGEIFPITSSATLAKGDPARFALLGQTEEVALPLKRACRAACGVTKGVEAWSSWRTAQSS